MRAALVPQSMATEKLFSVGRRIIRLARPTVNSGPKDLNLLLNDLEAVLNELEFRGQQLSLLPEAEGRRQPGMMDLH